MTRNRKKRSACYADSVNADKAWRRFETLIARIEKLLIGYDAVVKSPDRVPDIDTGQPREVDASIRLKVGADEQLITIECRERSKIQDVKWIEELATKRRSIGADLTIAVASKGFTKPARKKAERLRIRTRVLKAVSDTEIDEWLQSFSVYRDTYFINLSSIYFIYVQDPLKAPYTLNDEMTKRLNDLTLDAPVFFSENHTSGVTPKYFLDRARDEGKVSLEDRIRPGGKTTQLHLKATVNGEFYTHTTIGRAELQELTFMFEFRRTRENLPLSQSFQYICGEESSYDGREFVAEFPEETCLVMIVRDPSSEGPPRISVARSPKEI